jgi:hypothetical protein
MINQMFGMMSQKWKFKKQNKVHSDENSSNQY